MTQDKESVKNLSPYEYQKWLKWGKLGYDICPQTLERLHDFKKAVYDEGLDMMFKNHGARTQYVSETKQYGRR